MRIEAKEGFTFKRIHDGFIMGEIIYLGIDYSTDELLALVEIECKRVLTNYKTV